jgi:hypothetical protein
MDVIAHAPGAIRMFRCLRCHRIGNSPSHIAGCDCASLRRCEEVFLVPEQQLQGAVEAAVRRVLLDTDPDELHAVIRQRADGPMVDELARRVVDRLGGQSS